MIRTFIQVTSLVLTLEAAVFLAKGSLMLSAQMIAKLSSPKWDYSAHLIESLAQERADARAGVVFLLAALVLQMWNALWPMSFDDLDVNRGGAASAIIFCGILGFGAFVWARRAAKATADAVRTTLEPSTVTSERADSARVVAPTGGTRMSLTPGLTSARDLLQKLQRDADLLNESVTSDRFFNFVVTGYSLIDWIKNDQSIPERARTPEEIEKLHKEPWLRVCGDLANASKHFVLKTRKPVTIDASTKFGFGLGRFGKGTFGHGEESIEVTVGNGNSYTALEFVTAVIDAWLRFFKRHGIDTPARQKR